MNNSTRNIFSLVLFLVLSNSHMGAAVAANTLGSVGTIVKLGLNSTYSDDYGLYHGYVVIRSDIDEIRYNWGGAYCPGINYFIDENRHLIDALIRYSQLRKEIEPTYKVGQGGNLCLVSFVAQRK